MKPAPFDYVRADSLDEALGALAEHGDDAKVIAGGQSLMAMLNMRLVKPEVLVDIARLDELDYCRVDGDILEVGAACTQAKLQAMDGLERSAPLLHKAIPHIGHFQTRNRGTVCGSLCHSDPSSEIPLCLALLGGEVVLRSKRHERVVSPADFQLDMLTTDCRSDELVAAARFPTAIKGSGYAFAERTRRHGDFAIAAVAAAVSENAIRIGVGGVAATPTVREWKDLADGSLDDALNEFAWDLGGSDDIHASARYRREIVRRLGRTAIEEARDARV